MCANIDFNVASETDSGDLFCTASPRAHCAMTLASRSLIHACLSYCSHVLTSYLGKTTEGGFVLVLGARDDVHCHLAPVLRENIM